MTFVHIETELRDIKEQLDRLDEGGAPVKEIDELRDRVRDIERHLGINKNIAA